MEGEHEDREGQAHLARWKSIRREVEERSDGYQRPVRPVSAVVYLA